jgi:ABC-type uncharacterized transport system substrate-binding protein
MRPALIALILALPAAPIAAHPHIFVEARVGVVLDEGGRVTGVELTWTYDEFFSFMLTAELGLDPDGDLALSAAEKEALGEKVLDWPADFGGDLMVMQGGVPVALGARAEASVEFVDGRVVERHLRPLAAPAGPGAPVAIQVFDPFYYVAYEISPSIALRGGEGCEVTLRKADLAAAYALVDELLYGRPASDVGPDEAFPEVGEAFADTVIVTCGG